MPHKQPMTAAQRAEIREMVERHRLAPGDRLSDQRDPSLADPLLKEMEVLIDEHVPALLDDADRLAEANGRYLDRIEVLASKHRRAAGIRATLRNLIRVQKKRADDAIAEKEALIETIADTDAKRDDLELRLDRVRRVIADARKQDNKLLERRDSLPYDRRELRREMEARAHEVREIANDLEHAVGPVPDGRTPDRRDNVWLIETSAEYHLTHCIGCDSPTVVHRGLYVMRAAPGMLSIIPTAWCGKVECQSDREESDAATVFLVPDGDGGYAVRR